MADSIGVPSDVNIEIEIICAARFLALAAARSALSALSRPDNKRDADRDTNELNCERVELS